MTTTAENRKDVAGDAEATVEVPRPAPAPQTVQNPRTPFGYRPVAPSQPGGWGGGYPPARGPQAPLPAGFPTPPRRGLTAAARNARIAAAVAAGAALTVAVVAVGAQMGGDSRAIPSAAPTASSAVQADESAATIVSAADLPHLILTPAEVAAAAGLPGTERDAKAGPLNTVPFADTLETNQSCLPLAWASQKETFQGTGFTAMRAQATGVRIPGADATNWFISQGVFAYPSADAAQKAAAKNVTAWTACESQSWSQDNGGQPVFFTAGRVNDDGSGVVTAQTRQENAGGWGCWRGLKAAANLVMDFEVCGLDKPASVPAAIADAITAKLPAA